MEEKEMTNKEFNKQLKELEMQKRNNLIRMLAECDTFNFDGVAIAIEAEGQAGTYTLLVPRVNFRAVHDTILKDFDVRLKSRKYGCKIKAFAFQDLKGNKYNAPDQLKKDPEEHKEN
jgi:hypothetical protein